MSSSRKRTRWPISAHTASRAAFLICVSSEFFAVTDSVYVFPGGLPDVVCSDIRSGDECGTVPRQGECRGAPIGR